MDTGYSSHWYEVFLASVGEEQTEREVAFLSRRLPLASFPRVLDVGCGYGRHARAFAALGYSVVGVELDPAVAAEARRLAGSSLEIVELDMRRLRSLGGEFDAVLSMWASFGYFDSETNVDVLWQLAEKLRPGGRLVLDVFNPAFFAGRDGVRTLEQAGRRVVETSELVGRRRRVELDYGDGSRDLFEWEVWEPEELAGLAESTGLRTLWSCARFEEGIRPSRAEPRMQLVFERVEIDGA